MITNFFFGLNTVAEIKKLYRDLCKIHHPDVGGDLETMKAINAQYHKALKEADGVKTVDESGKEHTYHYDKATEDEIARKLQDLVALKMENTDIWLIGVWIWIKGDSKPYREALKNAGCRWHSKNLAWYYRPENSKTWRSGKGLSEIAAKYGAQKVTEVKERKAIA